MLDSLVDFQTAWMRSTSAPLRFLAPGIADAPIVDYDRDLLDDILPRRGLDAATRLDAYRKQYWFRLLTLMQEEYPTAGHLIGWEEFNPRAAEFLRGHPPGRDLTRLGRLFPSWLRATGESDDVVEASRADAAWNRCFLAPGMPAPTQEHLEALASGELGLGLQPSVQVLRLSRDWLSLRARSEETHPVPGPPPPDQGVWALARNGGSIQWDRIDPVLGRLLVSMRRGSSWQESLERVARRHPPAVENLGVWFALGAKRGWWSLLD